METNYDYAAFAASSVTNKTITSFTTQEKLGTLALGRDLLTHQDVDKTIPVFFEYFQREFLANMPRIFYSDANTNVDKTTLLKNIKDFYVARGTEKSFKLLFRLLYNNGLSFYYPSKDMLRVSDGKWVRSKIMRVTAESGNVLDLRGRRIVGTISNAEAYVDNVVQFQLGTYTIYELTLFADTIIGEFITTLSGGRDTPINETIEAASTSADEIVPTIIAKIVPIITSLNLNAIGSFLQVGSPLTITSSTGYGARAKVTEIIPEMIRVNNVNGFFLRNEVVIQRETGTETSMTQVTTWARSLNSAPNILFKNLVGEFEVSKTIYGITSGATGMIYQILGPAKKVELIDPGANYTFATFTV